MPGSGRSVRENERGQVIVLFALALLVLVVASALFSGSEAALFSLNQIQIRQIQARGGRPSR